MSIILKNKLTGVEKIEYLTKEVVDEMLVDSYVESKGDEALFYEFLSFNIKSRSNREVINLNVNQKREGIWVIKIDFTNEHSENFRVDMNNIKIPEKYLYN